MVILKEQAALGNIFEGIPYDEGISDGIQ